LRFLAFAGGFLAVAGGSLRSPAVPCGRRKCLG